MRCWLFRGRVKRQVDEVEHATEHQEALEKEQKQLAGEYAKLAAELSAKRRDAAERLRKEVELS